MTHAPGRGRNDPTLITMNNLTRDLRLAETERDRIKAVNAELLAALESLIRDSISVNMESQHYYISAEQIAAIRAALAKAQS